MLCMFVASDVRASAALLAPAVFRRLAAPCRSVAMLEAWLAKSPDCPDWAELTAADASTSFWHTVAFAWSSAVPAEEAALPALELEELEHATSTTASSPTRSSGVWRVRMWNLLFAS
jgi:hypothetical protein